MVRLNLSVKRLNISNNLVSKNKNNLFRSTKLKRFSNQYINLLKKKFNEINSYEKDIINYSKVNVLKQLKVSSVNKHLGLTKKQFNLLQWVKRIQN